MNVPWTNPLYLAVLILKPGFVSFSHGDGREEKKGIQLQIPALLGKVVS